MEDKKKESRAVWVVGQVPVSVEHVIVHRESGSQLSVVEALALILNKLDKLDRKGGGAA